MKNLNDFSVIGTRLIALYALDNYITYFETFGFKHIPKEIKRCIGNINIQTNIFRMKVYNSAMCGFFNIAFFDFVLKSKILTDFTYLSSLDSIWTMVKVPTVYPDLSNQTDSRPNKIKEIKYYFLG